MIRCFAIAFLALSALLMTSCGDLPLGWERDAEKAQQCSEMGVNAPYKACEFCCKEEAKASGHTWVEGEGCNCL